MVEARRPGGGDWGATFRVFGKDGDKKVELLRFDCFKNIPHYHYSPGGKNETHNLDKTKTTSPLVWVMDHLRTYSERAYGVGNPGGKEKEILF